MPYTLTIRTALPGTPLFDPKLSKPMGTSAAGHMWFEISDSQATTSYGFQPKEHGAASGPGTVVTSDAVSYKYPAYARTLEITQAQFERLRQYGEAGRQGNWTYFNGHYGGLKNSCVDFTWGALKHAGLQMEQRGLPNELTGATDTFVGPIPRHFEGSLQPGHNKDALEALVPPVAGSPLNTTQEHPAPIGRSLLQHLISDNDLNPEQQRFKQQLGPKLAQRGFSEHQINTLATVSSDHLTAHAHKGAPSAYWLSKDGQTVAVLHDSQVISEFQLGQALNPATPAPPAHEDRAPTPTAHPERVRA